MQVCHCCRRPLAAIMEGEEAVWGHGWGQARRAGVREWVCGIEGAEDGGADGREGCICVDLMEHE